MGVVEGSDMEEEVVTKEEGKGDDLLNVWFIYFVL